MDNLKLILGDSIKEMKKLPDASIDLIWTDPPYGHKNNDGDLIANREKALGRRHHRDNVAKVLEKARPIANDGIEANDLYQDFLQESKRLLRTGACCCCCCCGGGGPDPQFARWSLWMDKVLCFKQAVCWDKGPIGMGWHYRRSYEMVLVAQKDKGKCNWYDTTGAIENIIRPGDYGIRKIIPKAGDHPTQKPVELSAHFIRLHSKPGDTVLDPFMGRGSTGVAALKLGRKFIGMEIDPEHFEIAKRKLALVRQEEEEGMLSIAKGKNKGGGFVY